MVELTRARAGEVGVGFKSRGEENEGRKEGVLYEVNEERNIWIVGILSRCLV